MTASGFYSTALGNYASTDGFGGSFVFGDNSSTTIVKNYLNYQFLVRASGGVIFYTSSNLSSGVELAPNGSGWNMLSDRNLKQDFEILSTRKMMNRIQKIEVSKWNYINVSTPHIGPMAQDFYRYFGVGEYKHYINMIDMDGIVLFGISAIIQI